MARVLTLQQDRFWLASERAFGLLFLRSVQLAFGLFLAVVLPIILRWGFGFSGLEFNALSNAVAGSGFAIVVGFLFFHRMSRLPGVRVQLFVIPSLFLTYAAVMIFFFLFRIEYSRYVFVSSFLISMAWFMVVDRWQRKIYPLQFGIVPGGDIKTLSGISGVKWKMLYTPHHDNEKQGLTGVVADLRAGLSEEWMRHIAECAVAGLPVYHVKHLREMLTGRVEIEHLSENTLGSLQPNIVYARLKLIMEWLLALLLLPVVLPLFALIGVLIRAESRGPVFFRQERIGYRAKKFMMIKFRTMIHNKGPAENADGLADAKTADNDSRITLIGQFLRKTRLDELPQIINILRGEMSWIGPRPEALILAEWYEEEIPFYSYRHIVRPGISGWAQVNQGHVAEVDQVTEKLYFDFYYIKNLSFWLDILIFLRTVRTIFSGAGAR